MDEWINEVRVPKYNDDSVSGHKVYKTISYSM